jgi:hypothetical protein
MDSRNAHRFDDFFAFLSAKAPGAEERIKKRVFRADLGADQYILNHAHIAEQPDIPGRCGKIPA